MTAKPPPMTEAQHRWHAAHWQQVHAKQSEVAKSARKEAEGHGKSIDVVMPTASNITRDFDKRDLIKKIRASQQEAHQRHENASAAAFFALRKAAGHRAAADSIAATPAPAPRAVPKPKGWFHKATGYSFRRMAKRKEGGRSTRRRSSRRRRTRRHKRRRTKRRRRTRHRTKRRRRHRTNRRRR